MIIDGLPSAPVKDDLTAMLVDSDLEDTGSFECSNELFNRIHQVKEYHPVLGKGSTGHKAFKASEERKTK